MSIATAIQNAQQKVGAAYTAVSEKSGTLPATQDLSNLPDAIRSIPSGGGGGSTVDVRAVGITTGYVEGDKVILTPTTDMFDATNYNYEYTLSTYASGTMTPAPQNGFLLDYNIASGVFGNRYNTRATIQLAWNYDKSSVTGKFLNANSDYVNYISPDYRTGNHFAIKSSAGYETMQYAPVVGYIKDGEFVPVQAYGDTPTGCFVDEFCFIRGTICKPFEGVYYYKGGAYNGAYTFPSKYNGEWFFVQNGSDTYGVKGVYRFSDLNTQVATFTGWDGYTTSETTVKHMQVVDDNVDYIFACPWNSGKLWRMYKINKTPTAWTATEISSVTQAIQTAVNGALENPENLINTVTINCKDFGDYVEMYAVGPKWGYFTGNRGCKVAHFRFTKATDTIERLPDVFPEIDDYRYTGGLSVNWELGLISICLVSNYGDSSGEYALFVKKITNAANEYPYYAYEPVTENFQSSSITGFVKSNKGTDVLGNTILEVETVQDPDYNWDPVGVLIGMNVLVNKGEAI